MAPRRRTALWGLLTALVTATAGAQPTHVACVGDSLTMGVGASSPDTNYPARLQSLLGSAVTVRGFGHSGATMLSTGDTPYREQTEYAEATTFVSNAGDGARVDVVILLGTNDSKTHNWRPDDGGTMAARFALDCAALIDHFTALPTHPVVYLALPPAALVTGDNISGSVIRDEIVPVIRRVAGERGAPVIDLQMPTDGHAEYFVDGVHPNDVGYAVIAESVRDGLLQERPDAGVDAAVDGGATIGVSSSGGGCGVGSNGGVNGGWGMAVIAMMAGVGRRRAIPSTARR